MKAEMRSSFGFGFGGGFYIYFICLFFIFLTVIYLLTPYDMYWHLKTSATRTTLPIQLACFLLLLNTLRHLNFRGTGRG